SSASGPSTRAENLKAWSGSSSSCSTAPAGRANKQTQKMMRRRLSIGGALVARRSVDRYRGLESNPFEVVGQTAHDWDCDDFGKFVGVKLADRRFELGVARGAGLHEHRHFARLFDRAFPAVDRGAAVEHVHA